MIYLDFYNLPNFDFDNVIELSALFCLLTNLGSFLSLTLLPSKL